MSSNNHDMLVTILADKEKTRNIINAPEKMQRIEAIIPKEFILFHIEELTFEDESPRKEALENVISAIRLEGVNFIYLLLGDKSGVSFYFGIVKNQHYPQELELDVDDIGRYILKSSIEGNFRGSKITEKNNKKDLLTNIANMKRFAKVVGVPSVNEDNENFQGVDRVVDVMMGDEFGLMVLAESLSAEELNSIETTLYDIHNKLSPLSKVSIQESEGKSNTSGESVTKNKSDTTGLNESKSNSEVHGTSSGTSRGTSESKGYTPSGGGNNNNSSANEGTNKGKNHSVTTGTSNGSSTSKTLGSSETSNKSNTSNTGTNTSREFSDKILAEWMSYIDEVLLKRIEYGQNKGIFNVSMYLFADAKGTIIKLGNTIRSIFSGTNENKAPLSIMHISNTQELDAIKNFQIPQIVSEKNSADTNSEQLKLLYSQSQTKKANWMSVNELSVITSLPQKEVVGLSLKEEVEFGLNIKQQAYQSEDKLLLGNLIQSGNMLPIDVFLAKEHLNKHTFITGVTGSGKTTTCQRVLESADMPFMVIEPAKTEYRILTEKYDDILIFTLGNETVAPFRLNPFEFFPGENISSRVDMIKANIEAAFDMEAAIPQIIESALYESYKQYGWDIATSSNAHCSDPFADGLYLFPTLDDLISQVEKVTIEQGFDERLKNDYIGSIKARLQGLMIGAKGFMLNTPRSVDFRDLIEKNVIFELEEIKNGAEKSLLMGFILINLNEAIKLKYKQYKEQGKDFKHISLIEEAHRLLTKYTPGDNPSKKLGVETFTDMLAEVRKYGESLIIVDQIPNKLTSEVLKNTNTKIVHKLFASDDKEAIGNTMSLDKEQRDFLSNLEVGRAIVSNQDYAKPVQVQIKELDNISTTNSAIIDETKVRNISLRYYAKHYKTGIILGLENFECEPSIAEVETYLSNNYYQFIRLWNDQFTDPKCIKERLIDYVKQNIPQNVPENLVDILYQRFYKAEEKEPMHAYILGILAKIHQQDKEQEITLSDRKEIAYLRINHR